MLGITFNLKLKKMDLQSLNGKEVSIDFHNYIDGSFMQTISGKLCYFYDKSAHIDVPKTGTHAIMVGGILYNNYKNLRLSMHTELETITRYKEVLTEWESQFIEGILKQKETRKAFSDRQISAVVKIYKLILESVDSIRKVRNSSDYFDY